MADRSNHRLNVEIERQIDAWDGTIHGQTIKNMYENGSGYESICEVMQIDYEDYKEEWYAIRLWKRKDAGGRS